MRLKGRLDTGSDYGIRKEITKPQGEGGRTQPKTQKTYCRGGRREGM